MIPLLLALALAGDGAPLVGVSLDDFTQSTPACDAAPPALPVLDFHAACFEAACVGMGLRDLEAVLGPAECHRSGRVGEVYSCGFRDGTLTVHFEDEAAPSRAIFVRVPDARDPSGLGLGVSARCFMDAFGASTVSADVAYRDGWLLWTKVHFRSPRLIVSLDDAGRVTKIQLSGPSTAHRAGSE